MAERNAATTTAQRVRAGQEFEGEEKINIQ